MKLFPHSKSVVFFLMSLILSAFLTQTAGAETKEGDLELNIQGAYQNVKIDEADNSTDNLILKIRLGYFFNPEILPKKNNMLQAQETVLEIDLNALKHNFEFIKSKLNSDTKVLAVVKAFGYGSDATIIADCLQKLNVDYFAAADGTTTLTIYDTMGRKMQQDTKEVREGQNTAVLNVNELVAGTYILEVNDGQYSSTRQIIVQ